MIYRRMVTCAAVAAAASAALLGAATSAMAATPIPNVVSAGGTAASIGVKALPTTTVTLTDTTTNTVLTCTAASGTSISGSATRGYNSSGTAATVSPAGVKFGSATYSGATAGGGTISVPTGTAPCTASGGSVPVAVVSCSTWAVQTIAASTNTTGSPNPHPTSAPAQGQVTGGQIANICADVYVGSMNSCHFRVSGLVTGFYTNNPYVPASGSTPASYPTLTVNPNAATTLTSSGTSNPTSGCVGGLIKDNHTFKFGNGNNNAVFNVTAVSPATDPVWVDA